MVLRLFNSPTFLNFSLNGITRCYEVIAGSVKFSTTAVSWDRNKIFKANPSTEDEENFKNKKSKVNKKVEKKKKNSLSVVTPSLEGDLARELQNVVGLHIGPSSIYWAKIHRSGNVMEWSHRQLFPIAEMSRKIQLPQLYEEVSSMLEFIPVGNAYILEATNHTQTSTLQSSSASFSALLRAQLLAMLVALLNCRVESDLTIDSDENFHRELDCIHKVYFLRPRIMSRLFHLLVGTERVSALDLVDSIIDSSRNSEKNFAGAKQEDNDSTEKDKSEQHTSPRFTPVNVPSNIAASYYRLRAVEREEMCQALLVAMTFYDLMIFKDPEVLAPLQLRL